MLLFCAGHVGAQNLYTLHPPEQLTPAQQEAARKRNEERRRAEEAEKARVEAEKRRLGLGRHRDEEAEKLLKMKQEAQAGRSNKFAPAGTAKSEPVTAGITAAQTQGQGQSDNEATCEMRHVRQDGMGNAESEAEARKKAAFTSRCGGTLGGVLQVEKASCVIWDDGYRSVKEMKNGKFVGLKKVKTHPVRYQCYRSVQCVKQEKKCQGGTPAGATRQ